MGQLSPSAKAALQDDTIHIGSLVELRFAFGTERFWSGTHILNYDGHDWYPTGNNGTISPLESSTDLRANGVEMSIFLPMDSSLQKPDVDFQDVKSLDYKGRPAREILAFFDPFLYQF